MTQLVGAARAAPAASRCAPTAAKPRPSVSAAEMFEDLLGVLALTRAAERTRCFPWQDLRASMEQICDADAEGDELFWVGHDLTARAGMDYVTVHQARVAVLAIRVAARVGYERERRVVLGMAGALIHVGLWPLPDDVVRRAQAPTTEQAELLAAHPSAAAALVAAWDPPDPDIVPAIAQHHERADGRGFPNGLRAGQTHPYAQLLGLVDCYAEWTALPVDGRRHRPHEVVRELMRWHHGTFAPPLVKALLSEVTVFPPGSVVSLTTGEIGRVTRVNRRFPLRPAVEIISATGDRRGRRTIDLAEMPLVAIAGVVEAGR